MKGNAGRGGQGPGPPPRVGAHLGWYVRWAPSGAGAVPHGMGGGTWQRALVFSTGLGTSWERPLGQWLVVLI